MILTIDVGGTKVLIATFDNDGKIQKSKKIKTPQDYAEFLVETKKAVVETLDGESPEACSIALPGSINRKEGIVIAFGNLPWKNIPIKEDLSQFIDCPIYIENDAKMAALAEADSLKDQYSRVLYITVSTGIGLGLVDHGKLDHNIHDGGGKSIMMERQGKIMAWEEFGSGKAIVAQTGKMASELTEPGDWYLVARDIAIGLINVISLLSPECIVMGGGVGSHLDKFKDVLMNELEIYKSDMIEKLPVIVKAQNPEEAVVYGGYLLAKQQMD